MRFVAPALAILLVAGCSGAVGGSRTPEMSGVGANGLADGDRLTASLDIPAGSTVTIAPGAHVIAAPGVFITVHGVLSIASASVHAQIATAAPAPDAADAWGGVVVESGGRLDADGLDLAGAATALAVEAGSLGARYDEGTITDARVPFQIETGARLDTTHAAVANAGAASGISGELHASYLDYETSGLGGGLIMMDPTAVLDVSDSTFHSMNVSGGDYITSYASSLVHVAYSTVSGAHCAFHFDEVARFELDHVTAGATSATGPGAKVIYGAMLYGAGAGPNVISNSNFMGLTNDLDQENSSGPLTITNTHTTGQDAILPTTTWLPADVAKSPIPDAQPR